MKTNLLSSLCSLVLVLGSFAMAGCSEAAEEDTEAGEGRLSGNGAGAGAGVGIVLRAGVPIRWERQETMEALSSTGMMCAVGGSSGDIGCGSDDMVCGIRRDNGRVGCSHGISGQPGKYRDPSNDALASQVVYRALDAIARQHGVHPFPSKSYRDAYRVTNIRISKPNRTGRWQGEDMAVLELN